MTDKNDQNNPRFIAMYRRKIQRGLDAMGYPGGTREETAVDRRVIDAGNTVRPRLQDSVPKKRPLTVGR